MIGFMEFNLFWIIPKIELPAWGSEIDAKTSLKKKKIHNKYAQESFKDRKLNYSTTTESNTKDAQLKANIAS